MRHFNGPSDFVGYECEIADPEPFDGQALVYARMTSGPMIGRSFFFRKENIGAGCPMEVEHDICNF